MLFTNRYLRDSHLPWPIKDGNSIWDSRPEIIDYRRLQRCLFQFR